MSELRFFFTRGLAVGFALGLSLTAGAARAQERTHVYAVTLTTAAATEGELPLWLHANRHGLLDPKGANASLRLGLHSPLREGKKFDFAYGVEVVGRPTGDATAWLSEAYVRARYGVLAAWAGRMPHTSGLHHAGLSSGSLTVSGNAVPLPQISAGLPEYVAVPFTGGWLAVRGMFSHGWFEENRFTPRPFLHEKYGYLRLGGPWFINGHAGLVHEVQWGGGRVPDVPFLPEDIRGKEPPQSFCDFLSVVLVRAACADAPFYESLNQVGNHLGTWDFGLDIHLRGATFGAYYQHIFDDNSGATRFRNTLDGLWGFGLKWSGTRPLTGLLYEHLYTKNQSGPGPKDPDGGSDDYYNNFLYFSGWSYYDRIVGTPLFSLRPNWDRVSGLAAINNNRVMAHHLGAEGFLTPRLHYRALATFSRNYGRHAILNDGADDLPGARNRWALLAEIEQERFFARENLSLQAALAFEKWEDEKTNLGLMLALRWRDALP